jgi:hypothetical protein
MGVMRREWKESAERKLAKGAWILQHRPPEMEEKVDFGSGWVNSYTVLRFV